MKLTDCIFSLFSKCTSRNNRAAAAKVYLPSCCVFSFRWSHSPCTATLHTVVLVWPHGQGSLGCLSSCTRPGSAHLNSSGWIQQARFLRSADFPSCTALRPSPRAIQETAPTSDSLVIDAICLFALDIGGFFLEPFFLEPIQTYSKKIARY